MRVATLRVANVDNIIVAIHRELACFQLCFDFAMHYGSLYCPFKMLK